MAVALLAALVLGFGLLLVAAHAPAADASRPISHYNGTWVAISPRPGFIDPGPFGVWQATVHNGKITRASVYTQPFGPLPSRVSTLPGSAVGSNRAVVNIPLRSGHTNRHKSAVLQPRTPSAFTGPVEVKWDWVHTSAGMSVNTDDQTDRIGSVGASFTTRATPGKGIPKSGTYGVSVTHAPAYPPATGTTATTGTTGELTLVVRPSHHGTAGTVTATGSLVPVDAAGIPDGPEGPVTYDTAKINALTGVFTLASTVPGYGICGVFATAHRYVEAVVGCDQGAYLPGVVSDVLHP